MVTVTSLGTLMLTIQQFALVLRSAKTTRLKARRGLPQQRMLPCTRTIVRGWKASTKFRRLAILMSFLVTHPLDKKLYAFTLVASPFHH